MKLSPREQILVWICINCLVLAIAVKGNLYGKSQSNQQMQEQLQLLKNVHEENQQLLQQAVEINKQYEISKEQLTKAKTSYFNVLASEAFQAWLTQQQNDYDIVIQSLQLESAIPYEPIQEKMTEGSETEEIGESGVYEHQINMVLLGSEQAVKSFVDHLLHSDKYIVLNSFQTSKEGGNLRISCFSAPDSK